MVKTNSKTTKWWRRYKTIFIIVIVIVTFQLLLARYLDVSGTIEPQQNQWEPSNNDIDDPASARKSEDEQSIPRHKVLSKSNNQTQLNLDFEVPCQISSKEAISALNRAKTQECKQEITNITCLVQDYKLYPLEIKSLCPAGGFKQGKDLGCFKDEKNFRLLNGYFGVNKNENSPRYCLKLCLQSGFPYAGVQYSNECFCGNDEPPLTSKIPDSSCNMKCPGDIHATCGGYYTINVFQTGIKKFVPQVTNENYTGVKPVKIAFLLTLNGRALRQVKRLIKILYHRDHYYYIHVDVRQDYLFRQLLPLEAYPNIRLTRRRYATIWGGASLLTMLRSCMAELLSMQHWSWHFVLNLSESDFPVKTVSDLTSFLSANKNRNFVKSHGREVQRFIQKQGLDKTFVQCENRMWRVGNRQLPFGIQIDGGSDWVALSRPFVTYVADPNPDDLISGLLPIFEHTLLPAESFFHTALRNSKFCDTYVDNNLHVTNWKRKLGCKCQYKHVVDWCGCSPNDFRPDDWSKILNTKSRQLYFARKFEPSINQAVILQLELWLFGLDAPSRSVENLHSYWQSVYHRNDLGVTSDDALITLANSVARRTVALLSGNNNKASCDLGDLGQLLEVTSYFYRDEYKYALFLFGNSDFEVAVKPLDKLVIVQNIPLFEHLISVTVSSDFDQKEQLSRNFLRVLSAYSEPALVYHFKNHQTSRQYNMTTIWVDPVGNLQDVADFLVDEGSLVGQVKPSLRQPLLPGVWKIKIILKNTLIAQVQFLITPVQYPVGNSVILQQTSVLQVSATHSNEELAKVYSKFLPNASQRETLVQNAVKNLEKQDRELFDWLDSLFSGFYSVEKYCASVKNGTDLCDNEIITCKKSDWSSLAPDPKSDVSVLNESTGAFDIW